MGPLAQHGCRAGTPGVGGDIKHAYGPDAALGVFDGLMSMFLEEDDDGGAIRMPVLKRLWSVEAASAMDTPSLNRGDVDPA